MSTLAALIEDYEKNLANANKDLADIPSEVRPAWGTIIANAKEKVKDLKKLISAKISTDSVAIFAEGPGAAAFANLVMSEGEGASVDADVLYGYLAREVESTMSPQRTWGVHQVHKLHLALQEQMHALGLSEIPMPDQKEFPYLPEQEDVHAHVRKVVRGAVGDNMARLHCLAQAAERVVSSGYRGNLVPIVILHARQDEKAGLAVGFARGSATVTVGKDDVVDREFLTKTFKEVNKKIRKK